MKDFLTRPWNRARVRQAAIAFLCGFLGAALWISVDHAVSPVQSATLATVDVTGLIHRFVKIEATVSASPQQHQDQVRAFSQQLDRVLQTVAQDRQVILLPKEAVITGAVDLTGEVAGRLNLPVNSAATEQ